MLRRSIFVVALVAAFLTLANVGVEAREEPRRKMRDDFVVSVSSVLSSLSMLLLHFNRVSCFLVGLPHRSA